MRWNLPRKPGLYITRDRSGELGAVEVEVDDGEWSAMVLGYEASIYADDEQWRGVTFRGPVKWGLLRCRV